jgi:hypothetical protein
MTRIRKAGIGEGGVDGKGYEMERMEREGLKGFV